MSNFVIEIKPAPEFVDLFRAVISAMQAKTPVVQTFMKTPDTVPAPIPQQPVVPLAVPTPAPQYQAPANPTPAPQPSAPAIPVTPAAPSQPAPMPYPSSPASVNPTYAPQPSAPALPAVAAPIVQISPNVTNSATPASPAITSAAPTATQGKAPTAAAPAFTLEDIARAAGTLADAGKRQEVCNLIASFGIQTLGQLPKEQYGAFATALRQMGARI